MWRNHKRDLLLADYWFDFHSGLKVPHTFDQSSINPTWLPRQGVKTVMILFLDMHVKSATSAERLKFQQITMQSATAQPIAGDNPWGDPSNAYCR